MRGTILTIFGLLTWTVPGAAQIRLPGPAPSSLFGYRPASAITPAPATAPDDSLRQLRPTYWKEGALVGGVLGLVGGALVGHRLCGLAEESTKHCTGSLVVGGVVGAALLAVPGALIGGQFSKKPTKPDPGGTD